MCVINNPMLQAPTVFLNILCLYLGDTRLFLRILLHIRRISIIEIVVKERKTSNLSKILLSTKKKLSRISKMSMYQNPSML